MVMCASKIRDGGGTRQADARKQALLRRGVSMC